VETPVLKQPQGNLCQQELDSLNLQGWLVDKRSLKCEDTLRRQVKELLHLKHNPHDPHTKVGGTASEMVSKLGDRPFEASTHEIADFFLHSFHGKKCEMRTIRGCSTA